LTWNASS